MSGLTQPVAGTASALRGHVLPTLRHGGELSTVAGRGRHQDQVGWLDGQEDPHEKRSWARDDDRHDQPGPVGHPGFSRAAAVLFEAAMTADSLPEP